MTNRNQVFVIPALVPMKFPDLRGITLLDTNGEEFTAIDDGYGFLPVGNHDPSDEAIKVLNALELA
jgi:hypothetical protein